MVARSIHQEMLANDLTHVFLDLRSYISQDEILHHFPTIRENLLPFGVDITKDLVPVVPAADYACGGVWVDEWGRTTLRHLAAIGEVSCTGVHGANRLASTSLLEGLVWGSRTARSLAETLPPSLTIDPADIPPWRDDGGSVLLIRRWSARIWHRSSTSCGTTSAWRVLPGGSTGR